MTKKKLKLPVPSLKYIRLSLLFFLTLLTCLAIYGIKQLISPSPPEIANLCPQNSKFLSCGEKDNFINYPIEIASLISEQKGRISFTESKYDQAVRLFEEAWNQEKDPATLISLNNARIMDELARGSIKKDKIFTIAVVIPYKNDNKIPDLIGKHILLGVAKQQDEINKEFPWRLIVLMANDENNQDKGEQIASELSKLKDENNILGVVGPYSSHVVARIIDDYRKYNLSLISPTSTVSLENLRNEGVTNTSFWFRPVSTTTVAAKHLVNYLQQKGYQKVIIFYQDEELFGKSFFKDFERSLQNSHLQNIYKKQFVKASLLEMKADLNKLIKEDETNKKLTALVLLADAYTDPSAQRNKLEIIKENNGEFFIAGNNTVYDPDILKLPTRAIKNMVVTIPWFPIDDQINNLKKKFQDFKENDNTKLTWHTIMAYDATKMLVEAISRQIAQGQQPTKQGIHDVLASGNFETKGLTSKITLDGSDRKEQVNFLISPDCSLNPCKDWKFVDKYSLTSYSSQ